MKWPGIRQSMVVNYRKGTSSPLTLEYKSLITASENVLNYKVNSYNYNVFEFQLEVKFLAFISFIHDS